jgi:hypothetical protein
MPQGYNNNHKQSEPQASKLPTQKGGQTIQKKTPDATTTTLKRQPDYNQTQKTNPSLKP